MEMSWNFNIYFFVRSLFGVVSYTTVNILLCFVWIGFEWFVFVLVVDSFFQFLFDCLEFGYSPVFVFFTIFCSCLWSNVFCDGGYEVSDVFSWLEVGASPSFLESRVHDYGCVEEWGGDDVGKEVGVVLGCRFLECDSVPIYGLVVVDVEVVDVDLVVVVGFVVPLRIWSLSELNSLIQLFSFFFFSIIVTYFVWNGSLYLASCIMYIGQIFSYNYFEIFNCYLGSIDCLEYISLNYSKRHEYFGQDFFSHISKGMVCFCTVDVFNDLDWSFFKSEYLLIVVSEGFISVISSYCFELSDFSGVYYCIYKEHCLGNWDISLVISLVNRGSSPCAFWHNFVYSNTSYSYEYYLVNNYFYYLDLVEDLHSVIFDLDFVPTVCNFNGSYYNLCNFLNSLFSIFGDLVVDLRVCGNDVDLFSNELISSLQYCLCIVNYLNYLVNILSAPGIVDFILFLNESDFKFVDQLGCTGPITGSSYGGYWRSGLPQSKEFSISFESLSSDFLYLNVINDDLYNLMWYVDTEFELYTCSNQQR